MKNLQVSDNDLFGNRFNGHDLHLYLRDNGIESNQIVWQKRSKDPFTFEIARNIENRYSINSESNSIQKTFSTHASLYPFSYSLFFDSLFLETDIVHYHLIHNYFFNISHLPMLTKLKPTVWSLHDPWAVTGHCIHFFACDKWKYGCGDCPNMGSDFVLQNDATALNWEMKKQIYSMCKLDIVVVSKWMYEVAKASPLINHFDIHLIPLGINKEHFYPINKAEAKKFFKIPANNKVLAFRATTDKLKGLQSIKEALNGLDLENVSILTNDHVGLLDEYKNRFQIIDMGWIHDFNEMRNFYSAADLFLMPSMAETFGLSAVESMACGTPVIGFSGTALADTIGAPVSGVIVPAGSHEALCSTIKALLQDDERRAKLSSSAIELIRDRHGITSYISSMTDLYHEVIKKRGEDKRAIYIVNQLAAIQTETEVSRDCGKADEVKANIETVIPLTESMKIDNGRQSFKIKVKNKIKKYPLLAKVLRPIYKRLKR